MSNEQVLPLIVNGTLYILFIFSVITWTLIFFKSWQFSRNNRCNNRFNEAFWHTTNLDDAQKVAIDFTKSPQARLGKLAFAWLHESQQTSVQLLKFRGVTDNLLEQALLVEMQKEQRSMEGGLTALASIGSTAPFVGLFGTVLGIMHAMHEITASHSTSLDVVAGPIGDALVATAIGIAVAVPAVLAYNQFLRCVKQQRTDLENFVVSFMHLAFSNEE